MIQPPVGWEEIKTFYEFNPAIHIDENGHAEPAWERKMVLVNPPSELFYLGKQVRGIRVHEKIAELVESTLVAIDDQGLWDLFKNYSGGYNFRAKRESSKLSMHALGAALDFGAEVNAMGARLDQTVFGGTPKGWRAVIAFENRGWNWGGWFRNPDAMHFQFGRSY